MSQTIVELVLPKNETNIMNVGYKTEVFINGTKVPDVKRVDVGISPADPYEVTLTITPHQLIVRNAEE